MTNFLSKLVKLFFFVLFYLYELVKANLLIAHQILSPRPMIKPGIIKVDLDAKSNQEILALVNLITMTPGSLCIDISEDKKHIYVHEMYIDDVDKMKQDIKINLEKRILDIAR
jgi:multicomponent Na+:H+ antiporter subunit E